MMCQIDGITFAVGANIAVKAKASRRRERIRLSLMRNMFQQCDSA